MGTIKVSKGIIITITFMIKLTTAIAMIVQKSKFEIIKVDQDVYVKDELMGTDQ